MKTFLKSTLSTLLLAAIVSVSLPGLAQDDLSSTKSFAAAMFPAADASKLWLHLEKYKPEDKISVELYNERGKILYHGVLPKKSNKRNSFRQQFDMSQISDGKYTFRVTGGSQTQEMTFKLTTPTLTEALPNRLISMN
ncbi:hypothetical protein ACFSUS_04415 [Spirosoma soli]|uniref:T9SS type A sorting domain-containing protein n=1 Tax=Spirosoma soli TaxID=1770529 RepID=A0ABW5M0Q2_9BACT